MKMFIGNTPIKSFNINHFEHNTNDATMKASDLQAGITAYARGKKITGTGKCFSFAQYGAWKTNLPDFVPNTINIIQIGSETHPIKMTVPFQNMKIHDFSSSQKIAEAIVDGNIYSINASVQNGMLNISCDKTIDIELFYGKDEYI